MINTILKAAENFCIHQIKLPYKIINNNSNLKTFIAHIDIYTNDEKKYKIYIAGESGFIQKITKLFLEEDKSNEYTLIDMTLETANLIVGSAKMVAEDNNSFTIGTPNFLKIDYIDFEYDQLKVISIENDKLTIAIKEIF